MMSITNQRIPTMPVQLLALSAAVTTVYISPLLVKLVTKKEIDPARSLPPPTVLIRTVRPYCKYVMVLSWFYIRFWPRFAALPGDGCETTGTEIASIHDLGFLDYFRDAYSALTTTVLSYATQLIPTHPQFQKMASRAMLYVNDGLGIMVITSTARLIQSMRTFSYAEWKERMIQNLFEIAKVHVPMVKREWEKEEQKMEQDFKKSLWKGRGTNVRRVLPKNGLDIDSVINDLQTKAAVENGKWEKGFVSGAVYGGEPKHINLLNQVYAAYSLSNPLHPDIWPTVNQCEAELIAMTAGLLCGNSGNKHNKASPIVGSTTSGGTESIILAVRAHLNYYGKKRGIEYPEIICGDTAHAGLDKACEMFSIRLIKIPCNEETSYRLDAKQVARCMNSNVIMIYSSAPSFPQGVIDPIEDLSEIAVKYDIGLHVDACLGGFVLPFARDLGYPLPKFDFACEGVTSMSADTHKYGYASKGTSVLLCRHKDLRKCQYFSYSKWTGGLYTTPTIAGSRAGALIACAWASLVTIGESGFRDRVKAIIETCKEIAAGVSDIDGLRLLGGMPEAMIVCFGPEFASPSNTNYDTDPIHSVNIYQVAEEMTKKGWSLNSLQNPASVHLCVTLKTVEHKDTFLTDLKNVVEVLRQDSSGAKLQGPAAVYGMAGSMPSGPVNELLRLYTDVTLSC